MEIEQEKLERFEREVLKPGSHESVEDGMCVMEMAAFLAGEQHSDSPACASPVIAAFLRAWNDTLDDAKRQFLKPYALRVVGTAAAKDVEDKRAWLAADWLIRVNVPAWLELAGFVEEANQIRALPVIDSTTIASALPTLCAAEQKARAIWSEAKHTAGNAVMIAAKYATERAALSAAKYAAMHAAWSAALSTIMSAALSAAESAAMHAVGGEAMSAAESAAIGSPAWNAARYAALNALSPTVERLQQSAFELLDRMIAVR